MCMQVQYSSTRTVTVCSWLLIKYCPGSNCIDSISSSNSTMSCNRTVHALVPLVHFTYCTVRAVVPSYTLHIYCTCNCSLSSARLQLQYPVSLQATSIPRFHFQFPPEQRFVSVSVFPCCRFLVPGSSFPAQDLLSVPRTVPYRTVYLGVAIDTNHHPSPVTRQPSS